MKPYNAKLYSAKAKIIKALSHPSRLYIIEELAAGELCVCQMVEMLQVDFSTVSKHLMVLKDAELVTSRKEGKMIKYCLKVPCVVNFISCIEAVITDGARDKQELLCALTEAGE